MFTVIAAFATITSNMARAEVVPPLDPRARPKGRALIGQPAAGRGRRPLVNTESGDGEATEK